jgi:hypothetical protein
MAWGEDPDAPGTFYTSWPLTPATLPAKGVQDYRIWKELQSALNEREAIVTRGATAIEGSVPGDRLFRAAHINAIQGLVETVIPKFVNHTDSGGNWDGASYANFAPVWTFAAACAAAGIGDGTTWTRKAGVPGAITTAYGRMQQLDYAALIVNGSLELVPWINELYLALNLCVWIKLQAPSVATGEVNDLATHSSQHASPPYPVADDAWNAAATLWATGPWNHPRTDRGASRWGLLYRNFAGTYEANMYGFRSLSEADTGSLLTKDVDWYGFVQPYGTNYAGDPHTKEWNSDGWPVAVAESTWSRWSQDTGLATQVVTSGRIGDVSDIPPRPSTPLVNRTSVFAGWYVDENLASSDFRAVVKFNVAGGFNRY